MRKIGFSWREKIKLWRAGRKFRKSVKIAIEAQVHFKKSFLDLWENKG